MNYHLPSISIIIPIYNVNKYITRCLSSVIRQTYKGEIECLLVDDCGIDNSVAIAEHFIEDYQGSIHFRLLHHEHNRGLSAARNTGTTVASGEFIYYLDSDDELHVNAIELMTEQISLYPDIQLVQGLTYSEPMAYEYELHQFQNFQYVNSNAWIRSNYYTLGKRIPVNAVNKLIRRDFILANKLFFKEGIIHEDEHWMFYLVQKLSSMAFIFKPTYIRYFNEGSIMSTLTEEKTGKSWSVILLDWVDNIDNISAKKQLKIILFRYTQRGVWKYSSNDKLFLKKLITSLWKNSEIKCLMFLCLALLLRPFNKGTKCLRYAREAIYV